MRRMGVLGLDLRSGVETQGSYGVTLLPLRWNVRCRCACACMLRYAWVSLWGSRVRKVIVPPIGSVGTAGFGKSPFPPLAFAAVLRKILDSERSECGGVSSHVGRMIPWHGVGGSLAGRQEAG